ncbi:transcription factor mef2A, partial [Ostrinia furnacalis]|uniref:transcription factor mef2A n=1 Tax=Ostrinia furnacalis TaxID=93504 RepID=UPI00103D48EE
SVVISASVAISGQLPSSQELPYITPPSPRPITDNAVHFSGDSTDSAKGYTSISVREPLSNIRAQSTKPPTQPHYATVSDDSDEMYAAIEEASVGEGSDTYAQIAPEPRRREPAADRAQPDARRSAPPEIGASTSNATHSRQASSSSCSNSTGALGSPKPEKRQANSPLPPPPHPSHAPHSSHSSQSMHLSHPPHSTHNNQSSHAAHSSHSSHVSHSAHSDPKDALQRHHQRISSTGDLFNHDKLRRSLNEKHQRNNSCVSSSDFYGCNYPVDKHRFSSGDLIRPLVAKELNFDIDNRPTPADNLYNSIDAPYSDYSSADANASLPSDQRASESPSRNVEEMYAKVMKKAKGKPDDPVRRSKEYSDEPAPLKFRGDDPGYETIDRKKSINHGYETIAHKERKTSQNQDPGYETVRDVNKANNFSNNNMLKLNHVNADSGPNSIISSDAGYEHISKTDNNASDSDPNYEVLRNQPPTPPYATIAPDYKLQPTYSTVNKRPNKYNNWPANNNDEPPAEPNYESMPHEPLYTTGSESDPNYESVRPKDPNYESVHAQDPNYESLRCKDPKYESVRSKDSSRSKKDPNYESVKYFELARKEPPYEKVNNEGPTGSAVERSDSAAGYERINVAGNREPKSSINNGTDATVSDYFQV